MENRQIQKSNAGQGMGIAALILGILGVFTAFIPCFGFFALVFGVLAIIFGIIGYTQAKREHAALGLPVTGLILGIIASVFVLLWTLIFAAAFTNNIMDINTLSKELQKDIQGDSLEEYVQDTDTIFSSEE